MKTHHVVATALLIVVCGSIYSSDCVPVGYATPANYSSGGNLAPTMLQNQPNGQYTVSRSEYTPAGATNAVLVGMSNNTFEPATITVAPGTTVRWTNSATHTHTVTSADGRWDSGDLDPGKVYSVTFFQPGTYNYYCRHHKEMRGTVVVK